MKVINPVLGINERNIQYVFRYNNRKVYPLADDKLLTKEILQNANIPAPKLIAAFSYHYELRKLQSVLEGKGDFAIKPARGMGGGGILVIDRYRDGKWISVSGKEYSFRELFTHAAQILSGVYSIDNYSDKVIIEEKIDLHPVLQKITYQGIPDIRIILFKKRVIAAMLRIPTSESQGKANLHSGGIGIGIDLESGKTYKAFSNPYAVDHHPDTGEPLIGVTIPYWGKIIDISEKIPDHIPLGYMGIDFVISQKYGPQVLEVNVRPGLEIQNVCGFSLNERLKQIEAMDDQT
jgi:alpha-L-glutamate ligase-like protein